MASAMFGGINGYGIKVSTETVLRRGAGERPAVSTPIVIIECAPGHRVELTATLAHALAAAISSAAAEIEYDEVEPEQERCAFVGSDEPTKGLRCELVAGHEGSHAAKPDGRRWARL